MMAFMGEIRKADVLADPGAALAPSSNARTLRRKSGKVVVTDGPFAESKEQIAGYMVARAQGPGRGDGLGREARRSRGGAIEVRPIAERPG